MSTYLGIDLGTSSSKVVIMDEGQRILASAAQAIDVSRLHPGWSEQNPQDWIAATTAAIETLKRDHAMLLAGVKGIGLSGHMHGATLLDESDAPLRPCMLWNDTRSHVEAKQLDDQPQFRAKTGNIVFPGFTAPKLVWVANHEPDIFKQLRWVLLPKDYLRLWLTGEHGSEMSDAAGTSWLDTGKRKWDDELLAATGLKRSQMPDLVEGSDVSGILRPDLAASWGMSPGVVVAGGAGDNAAAACGIGAVAPGSAFVSLGTSGVLFASNASYLPNPQSAVHAFCHAVPSTWHQMGVILSATDSLNWLANLTGQNAASLSHLLGEKLLKPGPVTFLPYLSGERTPHNDAGIRGVFTGLGHESDASAMTKAVVEGVAFAVRDSLEALKQAGTTLTRVTAVGGGARSPYWLKTIATVLGLPVDVPSEGDFGAAFGAARLGLIAQTGADPFEICIAPPSERTIEPDAALTDEYAAQYQHYRKLYPAIKGALT